MQAAKHGKLNRNHIHELHVSFPVTALEIRKANDMKSSGTPYQKLLYVQNPALHSF